MWGFCLGTFWNDSIQENEVFHVANTGRSKQKMFLGRCDFITRWYNRNYKTWLLFSMSLKRKPCFLSYVLHFLDLSKRFPVVNYLRIANAMVAAGAVCFPSITTQNQSRIFSFPKQKYFRFLFCFIHIFQHFLWILKTGSKVLCS